VAGKDSGWVAAEPADLQPLRSLLLSAEWTCVSFSAHLSVGSYDDLLVERAGGSVAQAILLGPRGLVLPRLDAAAPRPPPDLASRLPDALTVMGTEESVAAVERAIGREASRAVSYHLMKLERPKGLAGEEEPPHGLVIRRASPLDLRRLYPLQRDYEKEEVLLDPTMHVPHLCRANLRHALQSEIVYLAEDSRGAIAKAGTNARGIAYDQIGGVFTVPSYRGRGIGRAVMRALLAHLFREKNGACLFVKKTNVQAIALYARLGFETVGGFRISYYVP
jgi:uncharacterized protein